LNFIRHWHVPYGEFQLSQTNKQKNLAKGSHNSTLQSQSPHQQLKSKPEGSVLLVVILAILTIQLQTTGCIKDEKLCQQNKGDKTVHAYPTKLSTTAQAAVVQAYTVLLVHRFRSK